MLVGLGLAGPRPDDLIGATSSNETGHWESHTVRRYNRELLRAVGTTGFAPLAVEPTWADLPDYEDRRAKAERWFAETGAGKPVMVKDPRMCLTMEFWRQADPGTLAIVIILRNPLLVARSLEARDHIPMSLGLAMWDRHMRSASLAIRGLPTLVLEYDSMLANPPLAIAEVCSFLEQVGIDFDRESTHVASALVDQRFRHHSLEADEYTEVADVQNESFRDSACSQRLPSCVATTSTPPPQLWIDDVVRLRRDYAVLVDTARQKAKQRQGTGRSRRLVSTLKGFATGLT